MINLYFDENIPDQLISGFREIMVTENKKNKKKIKVLSVKKEKI